MLRAVMEPPVLGPITRRGWSTTRIRSASRPSRYNNTYQPAQRGNIQVLGGKTGYNDDARYCLVLAPRSTAAPTSCRSSRNEGKLTRFGDVARVADWVLIHKPKERRRTARGDRRGDAPGRRAAHRPAASPGPRRRPAAPRSTRPASRRRPALPAPACRGARGRRRPRPPCARLATVA